MRKAFTLIEVIFVISIIGILAVVAIPKISLSKDNAKSMICVNEITQLIKDIGIAYMTVGYGQFKTLMIKDITNVSTNVESTRNGIFEGRNTPIDSVGVTYYCGGEAVVKIRGLLIGSDYKLEIEDKLPISIVGYKVKQRLIAKKITIDNGIRSYKL